MSANLRAYWTPNWTPPAPPAGVQARLKSPRGHPRRIAGIPDGSWLFREILVRLTWMGCASSPEHGPPRIAHHGFGAEYPSKANGLRNWRRRNSPRWTSVSRAASATSSHCEAIVSIWSSMISRASASETK